MTIAFQIIMVLIIIITFAGVIGERKDMKLRDNMVMICIAGILGFIIITWL